MLGGVGFILYDVLDDAIFDKFDIDFMKRGGGENGLV